jgi:hypothetical protein
VDGAIAELLHPVALELEEPAEGQVGVNQPPVETGSHERAEAVESGEAGQASECAETVAATRGGIGSREGGVLRGEQRRDVEPHVVVLIHAVDSRGIIAAERSTVASPHGRTRKTAC